jgi:hypothetical protein
VKVRLKSDAVSAQKQKHKLIKAKITHIKFRQELLNALLKYAYANV